MNRFTLLARFLPLLVAAFALLASSNAWALNTGNIAGVVIDEDGLEVPGALVILSGDGLIGGAQERTTGVEGDFRFTNLPVGSYRVDVTREGYGGVRHEVDVVVNRTARVTITLVHGDPEEVVDIVGQRQVAVDTESTRIGEVLDRRVLQSIPTGRSYQSAVSMASGVTSSVGGNPRMGGQAYNENTYMLDGVNVTDPVTGTFAMNFNYDAIQQIEVLLGGYEPEYGVSLGGIINLVTETGTNNLEFDTSVFYTNGQWAPRNEARYAADGWPLAPTGFDSRFHVLQVGAKVSGPVIRDRAFFIFSYQHSRTLISNAGILLPRDFDGHYVLSKLTVQPSAEHRFTALLQLNPTVIDNLNQTNIRVNPEAQFRQAQGGYVTQFRWQWLLSQNQNLDTQVVVQKVFIEQNAVPCTHDRDLGYNPCTPGVAENTVDWYTPGRFGAFGAYNSVNYPFFYFDDRWRYQASSKLSLLQVDNPLGLGRHDFKFGVEAIQTVWDQIQGYTGNMYYVDLNLVSYDPQTFMNYYWIEITGPIRFRTTGSQWNFFAQDAWKPHPNLTLKYGVRYDNTTMRNDLGQPVIQAGLLGPRAYAAWDPMGDGKTKVAGGFGRFNDTGRLGVASFTSASTYGSKLFLGEYFQDGQGQGFLNEQHMLYDVAPRENPNRMHETMRTPRVDELILIVQREVVSDVAVGTNLSYKMTRLLYEPDDINIIYDEDGSAVIGSRFGDPFTNIYRLRTPHLASRDYIQADFRVTKLYTDRWFAQATYTYTHSLGSSTQALSGSFLNDPQTQYNRGRLITDVPHVIKAYGAWQLPTDPRTITLGGSFEYYSGFPQERLYYSDGIGNYNLRIRDRGIYTRLPSWWEASVKVTHDVPVRQGKLVLDLEARNLFNNRAPTDVFSSTINSEHRMLVAARQAPLRVQLGARYQF